MKNYIWPQPNLILSQSLKYDNCLSITCDDINIAYRPALVLILSCFVEKLPLPYGNIRSPGVPSASQITGNK